MFSSYIAIGDSFTEGLGDPRPDGSLRGWADRVAAGLANGYSASPDGNNRPFRYANLAIRGRKLGPIIAEQLQPALAQGPDVMSFNAGGNNMLRPKFDPAESINQIVEAVEAIRVTGTHVLLLAGPDPVNNLPMGHVFSSRGEQYTELATNAVAGMDGVTFVDNFNDLAFRDSTYWSEDGLHLSPSGHLRVAANCLDALGISYPNDWADPHYPVPDPKNYRTPAYFTTYITPWIGRRLTGRSSGDGRMAKRPLLSEFRAEYDL